VLKPYIIINLFQFFENAKDNIVWLT